MDREGFRNRLKQYKKAREENPGLKYWEWKNIPKYDNGTGFVTNDPNELRRNIQKVLNTTPEGDVNPFYNSLDDTYGSAELPEVTITAPYTRKASLAQQAKQGRKAYHDAGKKAAPVLATIPLGAGILGAASTLGWSTAIDLIDVATNPTDPLSYFDKFDLSKIKKVDPMSKNAKPVSNKIFVDDAKVAGSTAVKPTYLDYGTVSFEDNILNERPQWVKDVQEFYDTDVATRERNAASTAGVYYRLPFAKSRSELTFNSERPVYVREYLDNVDFGGYANRDMVVIEKNSPFTPDEVLVHEGAHLDQFNGETLPFNLMDDFDIHETIANYVTGAYNDPKYKPFLQDMLDDGYEFTDNIGNIHSTLEKGATNREMRYNIWLKNNKPNVGELDNIIDEMSDDDIIYMLTQTNSYSRDVHKNLLEKGKDRKDVAASIRTALKTVPILSTPMILNFENDPQSSFAEGGEVTGNNIPTQEEYITQQIVAERAAALKKSYDRQYPKVPTSGGKRSKADWENSLNQQEEYLNTLLSRWGITPSQKTIWQNNLKALQSQREAGYDAYIGEGKILGPSCAYTTGDNYGIDCISSEQFRQNHADYGFREIPYSQVQPSDVVLDYNPEEQRATHTMMYSKKGSDGVDRFNHSNGGHTKEAIRKDARYPFKGQPLAYEFVGTPADSTQWINDYKKIYGYADGGEVDQRQLILNRANEVSTNYSDAKDFTLDPINYTIRKLAKTIFGKGGISNCTLSATRWVDPNNQYMSAKNIFNNPNSGYTEISKDYVLPGDLLITKVPNKDSYHTMLVEGFDGDEPILRYSKGGHDTENNLVTGRTLSLYHKLDKEQGGNHDEDHYFRYNLPNEYWLPEITVTPKK